MTIRNYAKGLAMAGLVVLGLEGNLSPSHIGNCQKIKPYQTKLEYNSSEQSAHNSYSFNNLENKLLVREMLGELSREKLRSIKTKTLGEIIDAMSEIESSNNPYAISKKGAIGEVQVMPETQEWMLKEKMIVAGDLFDSEYNRYVGSIFVKWLEKFMRTHNPQWSNLSDSQKIDQISAAYNLGPTKFKKKEFNIGETPEETRKHVEKIRGII